MNQLPNPKWNTAQSSSQKKNFESSSVTCKWRNSAINDVTRGRDVPSSQKPDLDGEVSIQKLIRFASDGAEPWWANMIPVNMSHSLLIWVKWSSGKKAIVSWKVSYNVCAKLVNHKAVNTQRIKNEWSKEKMAGEKENKGKRKKGK